MIRVKGLNKYFNRGRKNENHVLSDINLEFADTGLVCLLGESGSGKTTLLNTIGGLDTFSTGSIVIDDTELVKYEPKKMEPIRNDKFDFVFQNYFLLKDYTVGYNVRIALNRFDVSEEEKDERVEYVLDMLGMKKYRKKLVSKLSGGQQQRVAIARALVKSPDVIFADEPTGNLDEENTLRTMSILKSISKECLVILVTHERNIANFFADRIIEVRDGKIISDSINESDDVYERSDDSNIYLKELEKSEIKNENALISIYSKKVDRPRRIELKFAWKDGKLYIQNDMNCDILIEGVENGVQMLDEERPSLDMEDVDNFSYSLSKMKSRGKSKLPFKELWRMAVENISLMGKKQAFVIGILLVTAVLLSVTLAEFLNTVTIDEKSIVSTDSHYVKFDFARTTSLWEEENQWDVIEFVDKYLSDGKYGDLFYSPKINIFMTGDGFYQMKDIKQSVEKYFTFVDINHLKESSLIYGEMPKKRGEVVVDKQVIEQFIASRGVVATMYGGVETYMNMELSIPLVGEKLKIVGISDVGEPSVYSSQSIILGLDSTGYRIATLDELKTEYPESAEGVTLGKNQILMREGLYNANKLSMKPDGDILGYQKIGEGKDNKFEVLGTIPNEMGVDYVMSEEGCMYVRTMMYYRGNSCYLYTNDTDRVIKDMKKYAEKYRGSYTLNVTRPYDEQIKEYKKAHTINLDAKKLITVVILIISIIMIYFTIKSNAMSRSEELTVYRLLGISRGSIMKAYMMEMGLMTCYTSLPAVLITSGVIKFISSIPSLEIGMILPWWSVLILIAAIFAVHLLISIMPIYGILSKPAATLAVKE